MAKQQIEIEVLAPDEARDGSSGRQHQQYRHEHTYGYSHPCSWYLQAEFDYFKEQCSDSFSSAELKLLFNEFLSKRGLAANSLSNPSRAEIDRWASKSKHPHGSRSRGDVEVIVYFLLGCLVLLTLRAFING